MGFVKVSTLSALPPGSVMQASAGQRTYAICNAGGQIYALDGVCPHAGGALGEGILQGTNLVCPWHGFEFDCRTGENDIDPGMRASRFAVRIVGNDIFINPDRPL
ncbi:MAG TPA: Rieske 2Fe-2S domain-containing protein [Bryobacteraceae bacterium]|nr:Rieske 2Fe-2S domain-containing protein [Bryobacteraceae bacterium]